MLRTAGLHLPSRKARPRASTPRSPRTPAGYYKGDLVPPSAGLPPASHRELQDARRAASPEFRCVLRAALPQLRMQKRGGGGGGGGVPGMLAKTLVRRRSPPLVVGSLSAGSSAGVGEGCDCRGARLGGGDAVHTQSAVRAHLPAQRERSLAPGALALESRLAPRAEDELAFDALLAHRARVVNLDALQERLFFERLLVQLSQRLRRPQDDVDQQAGKLKTATSSVAATWRKMSVVRARMSRNVHHTLAIHNATRYAAMIVIPMRRIRSSWVTNSWRSMIAPDRHLACGAGGAAHSAGRASIRPAARVLPPTVAPEDSSYTPDVLPLPPAIRALAARLAPEFASRGHELFLVGGIVRDALLDAPLGDDLDFATSATPDADRAALKAPAATS